MVVSQHCSVWMPQTTSSRMPALGQQLLEVRRGERVARRLGDHRLAGSRRRARPSAGRVRSPGRTASPVPGSLCSTQTTRSPAARAASTRRLTSLDDVRGWRPPARSAAGGRTPGRRSRRVRLAWLESAHHGGRKEDTITTKPGPIWSRQGRLNPSPVRAPSTTRASSGPERAPRPHPASGPGAPHPSAILASWWSLRAGYGFCEPTTPRSWKGAVSGRFRRGSGSSGTVLA